MYVNLFEIGKFVNKVIKMIRKSCDIFLFNVCEFLFLYFGYFYFDDEEYFLGGFLNFGLWY